MKNLRTLMDNKAQQKTLFALLLSAGFVVSPAFVFANPEPIPVTQENQQNKVKVSGTVIDATGLPVIGASVVEKGSSNNGTITDLDGNFTLSVASGAVLEISFIGFQSQEIQTTPGQHVSVTLKEDSEMLEEVVVVGFGTQKKVNLTGSVSVVTSEEIAQRPVTNVTQALQGVVPGLQISQTNGSLENTPSINVRGTTTIGQGTSGDPLVLIDGMEGDLNTINPQDIASISVLKDAAASSIYGSRAPFGVILITTKSGTTEGKTSVNYNNSFRWGTPVNMNHMMNSVNFASWMNDTFSNGGSGVYFTPERMDQIVAYHNAAPYGPGQRITEDGTILYSIAPNTSNGQWLDGYANGIDDVDWYDAIYKKWTFSQEHNFSVNGGTKKLNYYASFNYLSQGGFMNLGDGTAKIGSEITEWLRFNYTMRFTREDYKRPANLTDNLYNDMARQGWPVLPLYDRNGYYFSAPSPALGLAEAGTDKKQTDDMYHQISFQIEPIKNWITHIDFNYHINSANRHWDKAMLYNHDINGNPYVTDQGSNVHEDYYKENYYNFQIYTEYTHSFNEKHNLHVMGGFQAENLKQTQFGLQNNGLMFANKPEVDLTTGLDYYGNPITPDVNGSRNEWATAGFFARVNYDYQGKYLIEANLRADGTSRFRKGNQWKAFPSVSVGWNIARENFFEPISNIVGTLKLRGSYGSLGNQNTTNWYQTYQTMSVGASDGSWLLNGVKPNTATAPGLVSTALTWETIESYNIGLDWGLFNNRLTGSFDYFVRRTVDMVGPAPELPLVLGIAVPNVNNADMKSYGFELELGWRDRIGKVDYGVKFNLSDAQQKVMRYPNTTGLFSDWYAGKMNGEIWGYTTLGIAKTQEEMDKHLASLPNGGQNALGKKWGAGDIMYADLNGDGKVDGGKGTLSDPGDQTIIGNSTPRYNFGLTLDASWNGFDFSVFFQGVGKRDYAPIVGTNGAMFWGITSNLWQSVGLEDHWDYFRPEGHPMGANIDAYYPRPDLTSNKNHQVQTRYLQNAAYIRLKNAQIGYTLPQKWTQKLMINRCRIYVSGDNLWTGTKLADMFDPETLAAGDWGSGKTYPLSRVISFGLNVNF